MRGAWCEGPCFRLFALELVLGRHKLVCSRLLEKLTLAFTPKSSWYDEGFLLPLLRKWGIITPNKTPICFCSGIADKVYLLAEEEDVWSFQDRGCLCLKGSSRRLRNSIGAGEGERIG